MGICLGRELQPQSGSRIAVSSDLRKDRVIIRRVAHYGHVLVILGRTAQHRRSADVDILDRLVHRHPFAGDRLTEGIEIHTHHVDELDAVLPQRFQVVRIVAASQQAAVHLGMERLDTSVADLREPRHIADVDHLHAAFSQQFHRTAGGDHLPAELSSPRANSTTPVLSLTLINALILLIYIGNHIFQYTISDDLNTESESRLFAVQ